MMNIKFLVGLVEVMKPPSTRHSIDVADESLKDWEHEIKNIERQAKASGIKTEKAKGKTMRLMKQRAVCLSLLTIRFHPTLHQCTFGCISCLETAIGE